MFRSSSQLNATRLLNKKGFCGVFREKSRFDRGAMNGEVHALLFYLYWAIPKKERG
jgi:hypothetical protein